jgi:ethanolamine utilization protein EutQ (cupin superfamily)
MSKAAELAARVDALETMISKLSVVANKKGSNNNAEDKKARNITEKGVAHKAKLLFYQDNKDSVEVKKMFKENNGTELTVNFKNWHDVKKITDILFDELSESDKQKYIKKVQAQEKK